MIKTRNIDLEGSKDLVRVERVLQTNGLLTTEETAAYFRVTTMTLKRWKDAKVLMPIKIGGRVLYKSHDVKSLTDNMGGMQND